MLARFLSQQPHYDHTTIGIDALNNGVHVLTEKPISVHKADAQRLIGRLHMAHPELVFCAMFNRTRTDPHYIKVKELIEAGELGTIQGSTGSLRLVQGAKSTTARVALARDLGRRRRRRPLQPMPAQAWKRRSSSGFAAPSTILAIGGIGKYHDIEVEDDITAILEYPSGATGVFVTTTGERGQTDSKSSEPKGSWFAKAES